MERLLDVHEFVEQIQAQRVYELPLEEGQYLGFFIPEERVVLKRIEELTARKSPSLVACPVRRLFE